MLAYASSAIMEMMRGFVTPDWKVHSCFFDPPRVISKGYCMNFRRLFCPVLSLIVVLALHDASACTTAIISGKCTPDGRPMLFKNRDTGSTQNLIMFFDDGDYDYIGVISASDSTGTHVWQGVNSAGLAIMNSMSYNINDGDTTTVKNKDNGTFMKLALQRCASLEDFERLLETEQKPLGVEANFGVIDAHGGAAYYEAGNFSYTKIDANDPTVAPYGYIIRTNYSFTGPIDKGHGYIRFQTAENLFFRARAENKLDHRFILQDVARCLTHSLTGTDLAESIPENADDTRFVNFVDYIPRHSTASSTVVTGVKEGESPELATMWTILGFPPVSVAVPAWVETGEDLPAIAAADEDTGKAPLGLLSFAMKERCFPIVRGSGDGYLDLAVLLNEEGSGSIQRLFPVEDAVFTKTETMLERWRNKGFSKRQAAGLYKWIGKRIEDAYRDCFGLDYSDVKRKAMAVSADK